MNSMSTDPHGILFYGFPVPTLTVDDYELSDIWNKEHGPPSPEDRSNYKTPEWDEWRNKNAAYEQTPQHVEVTWSGGEGCQQYYVHCPSYEKKVWWDKLKLITVDDLAVPHEEAKRYLHEFCDRFNIPKGEPGWYLAALYF
jgi:hypothetical protein